MPLATPTSLGDVLDARRAETVLGEVLHRDLDDALAPLFRVDRTLGTRAAHLRRSSRRHIVEPEETAGGLPPKRSTRRGPSGSGAPGDVLGPDGESGRPAGGSPRGAPSRLRRPAVPPIGLATVRRLRGPRARASRPCPRPGRRTPTGSALRSSPVGSPDRVLRPSPAPGDPTRPSDLAASLPSAVPPGSARLLSVRCFATAVRAPALRPVSPSRPSGRSERCANVPTAARGSTRRSRRSDPECAGQVRAKKSDKDVTPSGDVSASDRARSTSSAVTSHVNRSARYARLLAEARAAGSSSRSTSSTAPRAPRVVPVDEEPGRAVVDDERKTADGGRDDRRGARLRLERDETERFRRDGTSTTSAAA